MSKAILVLDRMYEKCTECPLCFEEWDEYTDSKGRKANSITAFCCLHRSEPICDFVDPEAGRPDWCQLKEPPKYNTECLPIDWTTEYSYNRGKQKGWNDCLDAIERTGN